MSKARRTEEAQDGPGGVPALTPNPGGRRVPGANGAAGDPSREESTIEVHRRLERQAREVGRALEPYAGAVTVAGELR